MASSIQRFSRFLIATAIVAAPVPPARAVPPAPVSVVTAVAYTYAPGDLDTPELRLEMVRGGRLLFANADTLGAHNILSDGERPDETPLFYSDTVAAGQSTEVIGVSELDVGTYPFRCEVHNPAMEAVLEVVAE